MAVFILLSTLLVCVVIGVPICYSLGASAAAYFLLLKPSLAGIFTRESGQAPAATSLSPCPSSSWRVN